MTELLSQLRLTSGMPFGMLFILVSLGGLSFVGIVAALRLRRRAWRIAAVGVAVLAGGRLALVYLNSAVYSAWAGGGPPTTIHEAWMHRAFAHLCYAVAALLSGFTLFRFIRRPPRLDRAALALVVLAVMFIAAPHVRRLLLVDRCLDSGGRWDAAAFRCQR